MVLAPLLELLWRRGIMACGAAVVRATANCGSLVVAGGAAGVIIDVFNLYTVVLVVGVFVVGVVAVVVVA